MLREAVRPCYKDPDGRFEPPEPEEETRPWLVDVAVVGACSSEPGPEAPPAHVEVGRPLVRDVVNWDEYPGPLRAVESVEVRPRVSGYLESIHLEDDETVEEGDLLLVIDPRPHQAVQAGARAVPTTSSPIIAHGAASELEVRVVRSAVRSSFR